MQPQYNNIPEKDSSKWCKHDKTTSHNTKDCFSLKKSQERLKKNQNSANTKSKTFVIQMVEDKPSMVYLQGSCNSIKTP